MNKSILSVMLCLLAFANAGQDYCIPGSDTVCKRFGDDFCCAKIDITKNGLSDSYHACSSSTGIDLTEGRFDGGGYSGTWYCTSATFMQGASVIALMAMSISALAM